jgi:hypothetical protein
MEKTKVNKIGIVIFIAFIALFATFSGYMFFNNSSNLEINIRSNNDQLKRGEAVTEALTKLLVHKNDTISGLAQKIEATRLNLKKDSVSITKKDIEIKKLAHEKDSLLNLIHKMKWSDIEPVTDK